MENTYIIDPANLEEHVMPNSTLLMLFMIFLCAHGLFLAFPAQPNATLFGENINSAELISLLSLTLGSVGACITRWSVRVALAGDAIDVMRVAVWQRLMIIAAISFGNGAIVSYMMSMEMPLNTAVFALFGTLCAFITYASLVIIAGQRPLRQST